HEILRTTFDVAGGEPVQRVAPSVEWSLPLVDLHALPTEARRGEAKRLARRVGNHPFDLARGPMLRVVLIRLTEDEHVAGTSMHHIVGDALSTGILFREMAVAYDALSTGRPVALPELPFQYADFARWQRRHLTGEVLEEQLAYWRQRLDGAPEVLELPADHPRAAVSNRGGRFASTLPASLVERLRAVAQVEGATLFMGMLAGFDALLQRWSGQDDLVVGFPVGSRGRTELEGLIGIFVNLLALRVSVAGDPGLRELLSRVRQATVEAYAHQDLPFEKLVAELRPDRQLSRAPVFQISFGFQNVDSPARLSSFGMSLLPSVEEPEAFDLSCGSSETPEGIQISWRYKADLFEPPTIARLAAHFETLLEGAVADPERPLSQLPLLTPAERHQVVMEWSPAVNDPGTLRPPVVHEMFEEVARERADAVALQDEDLQLTYAELNRRANRLARHLAAMGVGPEVAVGLCMERSPALIESMLGVLKTGGAYVPLDPAYPHERLAYLVDDAALPVWVTRGEAGETLAPLARRGAAAIDVDLDGPWIAAHDGGDLGVPVDPDTLAYVMYTSGSTGRPKGVEVPHRGVARLVRGDFIPFGPGEVFLPLAPPSFDASTLEVWGPLLHGGRLALPPRSGPGPLSIAALEEAVVRHGVTSLWLTTGLFHQVVEGQVEAVRQVPRLLTGGDILSPAHVRRALADRPGRVLVQAYGPTENTTFTTCQ
ncbi:MAG TPA: condensation domain-containing protein, partial [Thermoanaerobaculia bacterium]|nr:condensation domain-containing protein [Thermoanaerobaculia bacterium]